MYLHLLVQTRYKLLQDINQGKSIQKSLFIWSHYNSYAETDHLQAFDIAMICTHIWKGKKQVFIAHWFCLLTLPGLNLKDSRKANRHSKPAILKLYTMCICAKGEKVQVTSSCLFPVNTFPYIYNLSYTLWIHPPNNITHCGYQTLYLYSRCDVCHKICSVWIGTKGSLFALFLNFIVKSKLSDMPSKGPIRTVFQKLSQV